jgi:C1A family cysteine protease
MPTRRYGWRRDAPDPRDRRFNLMRHDVMATSIPPSIDLRAECPPVYDQGELGSCTANAVAGALEFDLMRQKLLSFTPSRLFIYYNERSIENTTNEDAGASTRDSIKSVVQWGAPDETEWPYDVSKFTNQPPDPIYAAAGKNLALTYEAVDQDITSLKGCLAAGFPFVFGFTVYESFEGEATAKTGIVSMPRFFEREVGGHAVMAVGYDDVTSHFIVRNSWGPDWGDHGYFYFPYAYMTGRLASDFWTIRTVE